jgi:hypothetical protein
MAFIEGELFHDKRRNLTVYKKHMVNFIGKKSWWHLLKGRSSRKSEWTWSITKSSWSILLAQSRDGIYWKGALPRDENEFDDLRKAHVDFIDTKSWWNLLNGSYFTISEWTLSFTKSFRWFYWHKIVITFLEGELFQDKRMNLIVYQKLMFDFIGKESWWHLFKGSSSTMREWTRPFRKCSSSFYWHEVVIGFIECELFHNKRRNLIVYEKHMVDFIGTDLWWHLLKGSSSTIREGT